MAANVKRRSYLFTMTAAAVVGSTLAGCLGPLVYRAPEPERPVTTAPVNVVKAVPLPPLPDPKLNNSTLAGIDTTGNGIRDDIKVWIYTNYSSPTKRTALTNVAKAIQAIMAKTPKTAEEAKKYQQSYDDALLNLKRIPGLQPGESEKMDSAMYLTTVNTPQRSKAYLQYNLILSK